MTKKAKQKREMRRPAPCEVKQHFDCDGTGRMCDTCGESEAACRCMSAEECESDDSEQNLRKCGDCDGSGYLCVAHDAPSGSGSGPCDVAKKEARS